MIDPKNAKIRELEWEVGVLRQRCLELGGALDKVSEELSLAQAAQPAAEPVEAGLQAT